MDDLIKQLEEKTGLAADQIRSVIEGVAGFLGDKLPGPLGDQVKKLLGGDGDAPGGADAGEGGEGGSLMDQAKDMLGGFLGGN